MRKMMKSLSEEEACALLREEIVKGKADISESEVQDFVYGRSGGGATPASKTDKVPDMAHVISVLRRGLNKKEK